MRALYPNLFLCLALVPLSTSIQANSTNLVFETSDQEEAFLVRRIAEFWKDQDYQTVKLQIVDFLKKHPNSSMNDHLRGVLADLYLQDGAYETALEVYHSIKSPIAVEKTLLNKMQCYYELEQFDNLLTASKKLSGTSSEALEGRIDEYHFLVAEANFRTAITTDEKEMKFSLLDKAKQHYEQIINSSFNDPVMFALAEIYRLKNENQKASSFFMELAERHPERREDLLFHAALSQSDFDKDLAIETFAKIVERAGPKSKDAALNRLILYFQQDRFEKVLEHYEEVAGMVDLEKTKTLDYIIGRSFFAIENYEKASEFLAKYVNSSEENNADLRNTLLMQLSCAQKLKNEELYETTMEVLSSRFPADKELPQALFVHAMLLKEEGKTEAAEKKLAHILKEYPDFDDPETLKLEYSFLAYENERWEESHRAFADYLNSYEDSELSPIARKYFLSCSIQLLKAAEENPKISYTKENFYRDLESVMRYEAILTTNEKKECLFLQGKIAYELGNYQESLATLEKYLENYPEDLSISEVQLMAALCHYKLDSHPEKFCLHAEKALEINPELRDNASVHLELFNAYLALFERGEDKKITSEKAAEHLYQALQSSDEFEIRMENKLWLANYYYENALSLPAIFECDGKLPEKEKVEFFERSLVLFEDLLTNYGQTTLVGIDENRLFLEWETMKYANLLGRRGNKTGKIAVLENLAAQQSSQKDWNWKLKQETLLELAKTYETADRIDDAFDTYQFLAKQYRDSASFVAEYATLQSIRLRFETLPASQKVKDSKEVAEILNHLKEVQIRKSLDSEPLHLEAALEYALIRGQLSNEEERAEKYLFFLTRIKEDFYNLEDPMLEPYQKEGNNDRQHAIFRAYMAYVEAEILRVQALLAKQDNRMTYAMESLEKARQAYDTLEKESSLFYLQSRIAKSRYAAELATVF